MVTKTIYHMHTLQMCSSIISFRWRKKENVFFFFPSLPELRNNSWGVLMLFPAPAKESWEHNPLAGARIFLFFIPKPSLSHREDCLSATSIWSGVNWGDAVQRPHICCVHSWKARREREVKGKQTRSAATVLKVTPIHPSGLWSFCDTAVTHFWTVICRSTFQRYIICHIPQREWIRVTSRADWLQGQSDDL